MPGLHVDDVRRVLVPVVQLELVDAEEARLLFGAAELPIHDIKPFKATLVDGLHDVRANAGELADLLVGERVTGQQEADVVFQFLRDGMVHGFERDFLHMRASAIHAEILDILEADDAGSVSDGEVLQRSCEALIDMQVRLAAKRASALFWKRQRSVHAQRVAAVWQKLAGGIRVVKACQRGWNQQVFLNRSNLLEQKRQLLITEIFDIIHGEDIPLCGFTFARCISTS